MKYALFTILIIITSCSSKMISENNKPSIPELLLQENDINIKGKIFDESIDLTEILPIVESYTSSGFITVNSNIYFQDCTFREPFVGYQRKIDNTEVMSVFNGQVSFINCKFEKKVELKYATFHRQLNISDCTFKAQANFQDITAESRANFKGTFFQGEAQFQNARFFHKSNFMDIIANGHLMFQGSNFRDDTNFSMSECKKYVDFSLCRFDGNAAFNYLKWKDRAVFKNSIFDAMSGFTRPEFGNVDFSGARFDGKLLMSGESYTEMKGI